jgi:hypothetical protein
LARIVVDAFLSDAFIAPALGKRDYKLTNALSDIILADKVNGEQICEGFAYPSVAHRGGLNFALEGDCFDGLAVAMHWPCPQAPGCIDERGDIFPETGGWRFASA